MSEHTPPRAMDFNVPIVRFDRTDRLRRAYGDEWEDMHRQAVKIASMTPLSYAEAVDRIIRRDFPETDLTPIYTEVKRAMGQLMEAFTSASTRWARQLREAGLLPEEPPADPRERALWMVKNRNTGPARPSAASARRPRRHN